MTFGTSCRVCASGTSASMITPNVDCIVRVLVQLVQHHARNRVALELDHDARRVAIDSSRRSLMPSSFLSRTSSAMSLHEVRAVDLVRNLGDDDLRLVRRSPSPRSRRARA